MIENVIKNLGFFLTLFLRVRKIETCDPLRPLSIMQNVSHHAALQDMEAAVIAGQCRQQWQEFILSCVTLVCYLQDPSLVEERPSDLLGMGRNNTGTTSWWTISHCTAMI